LSDWPVGAADSGNLVSTDLITERNNDVNQYVKAFGLSKIAGTNRIAYDSKASTIVAAEINKTAMSVPCIISTQDEDRSLDIIVTEGIELSAHQNNPVVNYNHGQGFNLPIGKAQDSDGNYTVVRGDGMLKAITYFSQNLLEAAQLFQLIEEGILNGVSIGAIPIQIEKRNVINWKGLPGLFVPRCELFEYSHTSNPDNRQALTERVMGGRLAGKSITQALYKSLEPMILPQPERVYLSGSDVAAFLKQGGVMQKADDKADYQPIDTKDEVKKEYDPEKKPTDTQDPENKKDDAPAKDTTQKPVAKSELAPEAKPGDTNDPSNPKDDDPAQDATKDYPPGAKATHGLYARLMESLEYIAGATRGQEHPAVKELLAEMETDYTDRAEAIKGFWKENYPDYDELGGEANNGNVKKSLAMVQAFQKSLTGAKVNSLAQENAKLLKENTDLKDRVVKLEELGEKLVGMVEEGQTKLRSDLNKARRGR
jgi:hypothetical protein